MHSSNNKLKSADRIELPPIPSKHYFTIGEAAELCAVKPHVLRYWEEVFGSFNPDRRGGRRYFQKPHILLARRIRSLLYEQGYTINGAQRLLKSKQYLSVCMDQSATPQQNIVPNANQAPKIADLEPTTSLESEEHDALEYKPAIDGIDEGDYSAVSESNSKDYSDIVNDIDTIDSDSAAIVIDKQTEPHNVKTSATTEKLLRELRENLERAMKQLRHYKD